MNRSLAIYVFVGQLILGVSCADNQRENAVKDLKAIVTQYERELIPIRKDYNLQSYKAVATGSSEAYEKAAELQFEQGRFFSNKNHYETLKRIVEKKFLTDPLLNRQASLLYYEYLQHQIPQKVWRELVNEEKELKKKFSQFRVSFNGKELNNSQIREILKTSKSTGKLEAVWRASKLIGSVIAEDLIKLVKKRNKAANLLGFDNYFEMQLFVSDLDLEQVDRIYDELDILTRGPYTQLKADIDNYLCETYDIDLEDLRSWHYQDLFFQNPPRIHNTNYDDFYKGQDIVKLGNIFYTSLGFDVEHLIRNSDLYPKAKKSQLGITKNIDYEGDVRVSINLRSDEYSMSLLMYELGFALYLKNISPELPYVLRQPAHFFTTDAIAILFSSLSTHPVWLRRLRTLSKEEQKRLQETFIADQRLKKFVFSRWAQVVYRFERSLYENPDQNLNDLWWELVENYQLLKRPEGRDEPDWATKEHLVVMPCKYHNYILGELFAAQLQHHISSSILTRSSQADSLDLFGKEALGNYLREEVFEPGARYHWQELVKHATGEELNPDYFYQQYIR